MEKYIGKKGYSIKKECFSQTELYKLRDDLHVKPNNNMNGYITTISYPIYRESTHKIYIPRYWI